MSSFEHCTLLEDFRNCGRQEEPAILIFRFLAHMRRMYVASIRTSTNGMQRTQFDHVRLDLLSLVIWSRVFWPSVMWNLHKAQRRSKSVWTFDSRRQLFRPLWGYSAAQRTERLCRKIPAHAETAVYGYDPALFLVLSVSCWCLAEVVFT